MLQGKHIRLRPIERADIPTFIKWINDADVIENLEIWNPMSHADEERWFENMLSTPLICHPLGIEVKTSSGWKLIGNVAFQQVDAHNQSAEIGIVIGEKSHWDKGFGSEAMRVMVKHGFDDAGLNRIFLRVFESNPRGIHCYENAGFVKEGTLRQAAWKNGKFLDIHVMSVLRCEWNYID